MLTSKLASNTDIEGATNLFEQLSISLDHKFLKHRHIVLANKPKLKRLLRTKSSTISSSVCSRCKKETVSSDCDDDLELEYAEKEVEVKKDNSSRKVHFGGDYSSSFCNEKHKLLCGALCQISEGPFPLDNNQVSDEVPLDEPVSESVPVHFQTVFFAEKPSIIGNNRFWLPQCSLSDSKGGENDISNTQTLEPETTELPSAPCAQPHPSLLTEMTKFFGDIFKVANKPHAKVLHVAAMLDETLVALTDEHFFKCKRDSSTFVIIDAVTLKDILNIMVDDACTVLVLGICRAPSLTEFAEFVPGYSEKTESLISSTVFALSRIKKCLPDVTRLPLLSLPTNNTIQSRFMHQQEETFYNGLALLENIFDSTKLSEEHFMMKLAGTSQFHPVVLLLRNECITTVCNGGCPQEQCKYRIMLKVENITLVRREDDPWPNCVRLTTDCIDITFASSSKETADNLLEKLYSCAQTRNLKSIKSYIYVFVSEYSMHFFDLSQEKNLIFGSPLLNLDISKEECGLSCIIESHGVEAEDEDLAHTQLRWRLTFFTEDAIVNFLHVALIQM